MKKLFLILMLVATFALYAQDSTQTLPDTIVTVEAERKGVAGFYDDHQDAIWTIVGALGIMSFLAYRAAKLRDALNVMIEAGQDGRVTEVEYQAIIKAIKEIWGKKPEIKR